LRVKPIAMPARNHIPPCPDPESYILIETKEGAFWRKKRGLGEKGAPLNEGFKQSSEGMAVTAPAAKRIVGRLRPFIEGLSVGRITVRISALLRKQYNKNGNVDYTFMQGFDLQPDYPMKRLLKAPLHITTDKEVIDLRIPVAPYWIEPQGKLVTHYYFELVVISGDCTRDGALRTETETSAVYSIVGAEQEDCRFVMPVGTRPWLAVLKLCCIEGQELAVSPKDYGMQVIAVG